MTRLFIDLPAINKQQTVEVRNMNGMFDGADDFNQNLGRWYIVPSGTGNYDGITNRDVLTLSAQNGVLSGHDPVYVLVDGDADNALFTLTTDVTNGTTLSVLDSAATGSGIYNVRIAASGGSTFGMNNAGTLTVTVPNAVPSFGTATVPAQTYTVGKASTDLRLPVATGGNGSLSYALTPTLPEGLTFDAATRTISGTPSTTTTTTAYILTVVDADSNATASDTATLSFSITVNAAIPLFTLDVDGENGFDTSDAIMIVRYALGISGANLTASLTRVSHEIVTENIKAGTIGDLYLDVDESGSFSTGDAIMIVRYALSIRGANLTTNLTRVPHETITANIERFLPK